MQVADHKRGKIYLLTSARRKTEKNKGQRPGRLADGPGAAGQIKEGDKRDFCVMCYLLSFSWSFLPAWAMTWSMVREARRSVQPVGS